jgi:hypothetical protein
MFFNAVQQPHSFPFRFPRDRIDGGFYSGTCFIMAHIFTPVIFITVFSFFCIFTILNGLSTDTLRTLSFIYFLDPGGEGEVLLMVGPILRSSPSPPLLLEILHNTLHCSPGTCIKKNVVKAIPKVHIYF